MTTETWTVQKTLTWTTEFFKSKQIESARLDAEVLLAHVLKIRRLDLYLKFDQALAEEQLQAFKDLMKRRSRHEPVAYIIGEREFYGRPFRVGSGVLIPRPETEIIVDEVLDFLLLKEQPSTDTQNLIQQIDQQGEPPTQPRGENHLQAAVLNHEQSKPQAGKSELTHEQANQVDGVQSAETSVSPSTSEASPPIWAKLGPKQKAAKQLKRSKPRILDVGAGSGCLGISLALELPDASVIAVEKSTQASELCIQNATKLGASNNFKLLTAAFESVAGTLRTAPFDVIVSNPPYIGETEKGTLPSDVKDHEPSTALFGGRNGYELVVQWLPLMALLLKPNGLIVVEIGEKQGSVLLAENKRTSLFANAQIVNDYSNRPRFFKAFGKE